MERFVRGSNGHKIRLTEEEKEAALSLMRMLKMSKDEALAIEFRISVTPLDTAPPAIRAFIQDSSGFTMTSEAEGHNLAETIDDLFENWS